MDEYIIYIVIGLVIVFAVIGVTIWAVIKYSTPEHFYNTAGTEDNTEDIDCDTYTFNQKILRNNTRATMSRYALAAAVWALKKRLELPESEDLTRSQLEELSIYDDVKKEFFPGDTNLSITAFNELIRRNFDHDSGKLSNYALYSGLRELDNQCDIIPDVCKTTTDTQACDDINLMINTGAPEINAAIRSNPTRVPFSTSTNKDTTPANKIEDVPRAEQNDINGIQPIPEISPDITADGAEPSIANKLNNADRTDPMFKTNNGQQSPSMVGEGREDEVNPLLNRDAQRLYKFVLDKIAALYSNDNIGGNVRGDIGTDLRASIDGLTDGQRAALCSAYCGQFTPCSQLCRYMGCINCTVGNTPVDRQNPGNTGGGIGSPIIDMRGMVLPGSARITDDYMLLDSKVIEYQAVPSRNGKRTQGGLDDTLKGLIDMGDDMKGVVNIFAPTVHVHSKPQK